MVTWKIKFTKQAEKDLKRITSSHLQPIVLELLALMKKNPFANPPPFEKLRGDLKDYYSRRINLQHRLIYYVFKEDKIIKIIRMWTHYE